MASYFTKYGSQTNAAPAKQQFPNTNNQIYSTTNQYNSGQSGYQGTGTGTTEDYSGYYGTAENLDSINETNQNYYPTEGYSNSYASTAPSNQTTASATQNNIRGYDSFGQFRQYYANRQQNQKSQGTKQAAPTLFMGKDPSYPSDLNSLMNPFFCGVCEARLNSIKSANIHYESKAHDRHINGWLKKTYTDNGLNPPEVQRFVTEMSQEGPGVYHCELCKLELSSAQHALQHFNGKRHRQAVSKFSPPTGIGYFNVEGKWVQTGKVIDKVTGKETSYILVKTPTGFEPVVLQVAPIVPGATKKLLEENKPDEPPAKKMHIEEPTEDIKDLELKKKQEDHYRSMVTDFTTRQLQQGNDGTQPENSTLQEIIKKPALPDSTTTNSEYQSLLLQSHESPQRLQSPQEALESLNCKTCGIATTSKDQMLMHLKGARHTKKLKALGEHPMVFQGAPATILESLDNNDPLDISMYRTPSGSYYCKMCNAAIAEVARMRRHISSKKHMMAAKCMSAEEELAAAEASKGQ